MPEPIRLENKEQSMLPWEALRIRYIKLGRNGRWWSQCRERKIIRLGFNTGDPEILNNALNQRWDLIQEYWAARSGTPTAHTNATKEFINDDGRTLWITFEEGSLFYGFTDGGDLQAEIIAHDESSSYRKMAGAGWSNLDASGKELRFDDLSGKLTKTAAFRQTICKLTESNENYLRNRLMGGEQLEVLEAKNANHQLIDKIACLVRSFTWWDFELLIELIFANSGWQRVSRTGGTQKTTDLDLLNQVTGDMAFVQIKSATTNAEFRTYRERKILEKGHFDRMFYVFHTGQIDMTSENGISTWNVEKVAEQVLANGLVDWVINRAK